MSALQARFARNLVCPLLFLIVGVGVVPAQTSAWKPDKHVELVVPFAAGTALDTAARSMQSTWTAHQWVPVASTVVNKGGGNGNLGWLYLSQRPKDPHYLAISSPTLLTNRIIGVSQYNYSDFTPIAVMLNEYTVFAVKADSPVKDARDLVQRLKASPGGLSISVGSAVGNSNHIAAAVVARASGVDPRQLKVVAFASAGAGMTALLGGHVDVAISSLGVFVPHVQSGALRLIAVAAGQRLRSYPDVPTWRETGVQGRFGSWRAVFAPKDIGADATRFWEQTLEKVSKTDEWQKMAASRLWDPVFRGSEETRSLLENDYKSLRAVLTDLGMAK